MGKEINKLALKTGWLDIGNYKPSDTYIFSTTKNRAIDSAISMLTCVYGQDLEWPLPSAEKSGFEMSIEEENSFLLRPYCKRVFQTWDQVKTYPTTLDYYNEVMSYLEDDWLDRIRYLTGIDSDTDEMLDVVDYIDWA